MNKLQKYAMIAASTLLAGCASMKPVEKVRPYCTLEETVNIENKSIFTLSKEINSLEKIPDPIQRAINDAGSKVIYSFVNTDCDTRDKFPFIFNPAGFCYLDESKYDAIISPIGDPIAPFIWLHIFPPELPLTLIKTLTYYADVSIHEYGHLVDRELFLIKRADRLEEKPKKITDLIGLYMEGKISVDSLINEREKILITPEKFKELDETNFTGLEQATFSQIQIEYAYNIDSYFSGNNTRTIILSSTPEFRYLYEKYKGEDALTSSSLFPNNPGYANTNESECFASFFSAFYLSDRTRNEMKEQVPLMYDYFTGIENKMLKDGFLCQPTRKETNVKEVRLDKNR